MMELNDEQKAIVKQWAEEGCGLSEIQRRLQTELDIPMTYMDVRFLILDLGITLKDKQVAVPKDEHKAVDGAPAADAGMDKTLTPETSSGAGSVSVTVDKVVQPGALASGTVSFSDGVNAKWMLDQLGRLALDGPSPEYRPSPGDVDEFQKELARVLQQRGF